MAVSNECLDVCEPQSPLVGYRLSPQQRRVWRSIEARAGDAYRFSGVLEIDGALDRERLARALSGVCARHEILRTRFRRVAAMTMPLQVIVEAEPPALDFVDLSAAPVADRARRSQELYRALRSSELDAAEGPLWRAQLVELAPRRHELQLVVSSLCTDAVGLKRLAQEIVHAYAGGQPEPAEPMQYADLAEWQNELLESEETSAAREHWRAAELGDLELRLPFERRRKTSDSEPPSASRSNAEREGANGSSVAAANPDLSSVAATNPDLSSIAAANPDLSGVAAVDVGSSAVERPGMEASSEDERVTIELGAALTRGVDALADGRGVPRHVPLLACWQLLLARFAALPRVTVGVAFDGRTEDELHDVIGPLTRYVPVAFAFASRTPAADSIDAVAETCDAAALRQDSFDIGSWAQAQSGAAALARVPIDFDAAFDYTDLGGECDVDVSGASEVEKIDESQRDASQVDALQVDGSEVDASEVDASEVDATEVDALQLDASQVEATEVDASRIDAPQAAVLRWRARQWRGRSEDFGLRLWCRRAGDRLECGFEHHGGRYGRGDVLALARCYETLLRAVVETPEAPIESLPLLGDAERRRLLHELAGEPLGGGRRCVPERIEAQAVARPDAVALTCDGASLTYSELVERARRIGRALRARGVGPEQRVALCADRSAELVIGILGVWQAGGAYVVLDPSQPAARLSRLIDDARPRVVLAQSKWLRHVPAAAPILSFEEAVGASDDIAGPGHGAATELTGDGDSALLNSCAGATAQRRNAHREEALAPEHLAYVMYTSGSTGEPKGVQVTHGQLGAYVEGATRRLSLPGGAHYAVVSTFASDLGHTMLWPALIGGGCLHVLGHERAADGEALARYVASRGIECMKIVPSHLGALLGARSPALPLRRLVIGGEALSWALVERLRALSPRCEVFNHYGPTETTVGVVAGAVPGREAHGPAVESVVGPAAEPAVGSANGPAVGPASGAGTGTVPLGWALAGVRAYVLDECLNPVPRWMEGELYIGGETVARGYLERPELTAERFVPDAWSGAAGARCYRTGDRVRVLPGGALQFLGRADGQVKLRGYRIELEEIEAAARRVCAGLTAAVAVLREERDGEPRLVLYGVGGERGGEVEPARGEEPEPARAREEPEPKALRERLREELPEHMVPSAVVVLAALPLTGNGKVDRSALPAPRREAGDKARPRTETEALLADIWSDVLGADDIGVHDDFFELGGHSLMITRAAARIFGTFGIELPFRVLLEKRTVAELAEAVEALRGGRSDSAPPLRPMPRREDAPLSFAQQRLWFFEQLEPGGAAYNIPGAAALEGALDVTALERTFTEIVRRHEILRTRFPDNGGRPLPIVSEPKPVRVPVTDLRGLASSDRDAAVRRIVNEQVRRPFDLGRGPLLRVGLLRLGDRSHVLWLCMHHIVADAWSIDLLVQEVGTLYRAFATAADNPLEPLPLQYADFAAWQRERMTPEVLERLSSFWRRRLAGAPQRLRLPVARPRPATGLPRGAKRTLALPESVAAGAVALGRREGATLFMTLLAAFDVLLAHRTASTDIVVGTNTASRTHPQTANLIGFFVNQLVLRADLSGNPSFRELLARVREAALSAYAHQDLPFEQLVADLRVERATAHSPLFQIKFELREAADRVLRLPNLTLTPIATDHVVVRHDLHMIVSRDQAGLAATLLYDARLFDEGTIAGLLEEFRALVELAVTKPDASVAELLEALAQRRSGQRIAAARSLQALSTRMLRSRRRRAASM